ncbi:probable galactosyl transferase, partial [unidentified eubacterium SCB49]
INKGYDINWFVLGEGQERINLSSLIEKLNLSNSFYLLGSKENPYPYMKMCDIYVQTSIFEGLGLTVIEASYLNKPIVSTNFPTVFEIITDNKTGLIAEMTAESIALKIEKLLINKELGATFSNNLAQQDNYDKEETLTRFYSLLNN